MHYCSSNIDGTQQGPSCRAKGFVTLAPFVALERSRQAKKSSSLPLRATIFFFLSNLRRLLYSTTAFLHPSPPHPGVLKPWLSTFSQHTAHLNPDHGEEPTIRPPAVSTLTPSPFSNRTFSPLCLPVTPHLPHFRISMVRVPPFEVRHSARKAVLALHRQMLRLPKTQRIRFQGGTGLL